MGNCNNFCEPETSSELFRDPPEPKTGDLMLNCQLCSQQVQHTKFKQHLDFCHFALITQSNQQFQVQCLLCGYKSSSLEGLASHIKQKHKYLKQQIEENKKLFFQNEEIVEYLDVKKKTKEVQKNDFDIIRGKQLSPNHYQAEYELEKYEAVLLEKQYHALSYDEEEAKGDLVWRHLFTGQHNFKYFSFSTWAMQKAIFCQAILLCKAQQ